VLVFALLFGGLATVLISLGARDAVEQHRIESAGRCVRIAQTDCIRLVSGVLDGPVSGGRGHLTWEVVPDRAGVVWVDISTVTSKDVARVAPERVTAAVWNGEVVWLETSLGQVRDTFHSYASAAVVLLFGISFGALAVMLGQVAVGVRRRTGSWWSAAGPDHRVDPARDTAVRVSVGVMTLALTAAFSVGFSTSLWGLLVPAVGGLLYLWHRAARDG
jgi:hypothetical protein